MSRFPKILVTCPTASAKNYCAEEWIKHTQKFTYPNYDVVVFDNTPDDIENTMFLRKTAIDNLAMNYEVNWSGATSKQSVIERMCNSHNFCRDMAIELHYTHLLHLESDVFPPLDVIERLLFHGKKVCGGLYYRDSGVSRRLMAQKHIHPSPRNIISDNFLPEDDLEFVDGTLKTASSIGLGCVLISVDILKKIPFRFVEGIDMHPDSYFAEDCFKNNIKIFADTSIICEHRNENWDIHGLNR